MPRRLGRRRRRGLNRRWLLRLKLLPVDVFLIEFFRNALLETRDTFRENWLAIARQLFLGVEHIEHIGGVEAARTASRQSTRNSNQDGGSDQAM
ncbi:MAG: hypothetical protein WBH00_17910 [Xanthobacteraceae bacterium]|jgi:hypothetical protein